MGIGGRFIEIAREPARLALRNGCVVVQRRTPEGGELPEVVVPVGELASVVLAHPQASITHPAMAAMMAAGCSLIISDAELRPAGMMIPLVGGVLQTQRMLAQVAAPLPLRKRLWKQIVQVKVRSQAATLENLRPEFGDGGLRDLAAKVRSGDPANIEGQAAARYWPLLMAEDFRRRFDAPDQNRLLNYGYAVLRAAVARAVVAVGLHPSLGLHHKARTNPFCLADDLMEPYRPLIDAEVAKIAGETGGDTPLDGPTKARLIELLDLRMDEAGAGTPMRPVCDHIGRTAWSLSEAFMKARRADRESPTLFYPKGLWKW